MERLVKRIRESTIISGRDPMVLRYGDYYLGRHYSPLWACGMATLSKMVNPQSHALV